MSDEPRGPGSDRDPRPDSDVIPAPGAAFAPAVRWSYVMNIVRILATLVTTFVIAGLLGPEAFGTVALALIYITLLQLLMQQGLIPALIQRPDLNRRHLDSAFWLTMAASLLFTVVSLALAGWWASVNGAPRAREVIWALSVLVGVRGLSVVQEALLRRQLRFRELALRTTVASAAGASVGLTWALITPSLWALVAQQLTTNVVGAVMLWSVSGWRPRVRFWAAEARELRGFTLKSTLSSLGVFVNNRVDALLVGIFFGAMAVGLYRLASRAVESAIEFAVQPIQGVALPEFSRYQHDVRRLRGRYVDLVLLSAGIGAPVMATTFAVSTPLMQTLGPEWSAAATALQLLCIVGLVRAVTLLNGAAIQAAGRPGAQAAMTWFAAALSALGFLVAGLLLREATVDEQVVGMAGSRALIYVFVLLPVGQTWLITRIIGVGNRRFARAVLPTTVVAAGVAIVADAIADRLLADDVEPVAVLVGVGALTAMAAVAATSIVNPATRRLIARALRRSRAAGARPAASDQPASEELAS